MVDGAGNVKAVDVSLKRTGGDARRIAIHVAEGGRLQYSWEKRDLPSEPDTETGPVKANERVAEAAEWICRSEEDQAPDAIGMARGKHHGHGATVGMAGDVRFREAKSVHAGSQSIRGGFEPGVKARHALRFAHVEEIDGVDAGVARQKADVLSPVFCRPDETVQEQKRTTCAGSLIMDLCAAHQDEGLFDIYSSRFHGRRSLDAKSAIAICLGHWMLHEC